MKRGVESESEREREERLSKMTVEEASRLSALVLAAGPPPGYKPIEEGVFIPLAEMIRRHRMRRRRAAKRRSKR